MTCPEVPSGPIGPIGSEICCSGGGGGLRRLAPIVDSA